MKKLYNTIIKKYIHNIVRGRKLTVQQFGRKRF